MAGWTTATVSMPAVCRLFCRDFNECRAQLQGCWLDQDDWSPPCHSCGIFTGFLYRVGNNTSYVRWWTTSCMVPRLATSLTCFVRVEMCDCDRVLVGTTSFPFSRLSMTRKSFRFFGPRAWNSLQSNNPNAPSWTVFCKQTQNPSFQTYSWNV